MVLAGTHVGGMLNHHTARTRHQGLGHVVECVGLVDPTGRSCGEFLRHAFAPLWVHRGAP